MRRALVAVLVLMAGCATLAPVEVTHDFHAPPAQVQAAALAAAARMGWGDPASPPEHLTFTETPRLRAYPLELLTAGEGTLHVQSRVPAGATPEQSALQPAAALLIQATQQVLDPAEVSPKARPVEPRSLGLTVALDLLLPEVGGVYALRGDPNLVGNWQRSWQFNLLMTSLLDVLGAINLGAGVSLYKQPGTHGTLNLIVGAACLASNRIVSAIADGMDVAGRNRLSASGFAFDLSELPQPHGAAGAAQR